jgi:hypothetical protein
MPTYSSERGFSLTELMIASLVTMLVMGVTFRAFQDALTLNDVATQMTDASQNLRAGSNLLTRDLLEAGRNIPIGGIAIPSGVGATAIHRPGPDPSQVFDNTTATTLPTIATGGGKGPVIDGKATDFITMVMDDPFLSPLTVYPSTNVTNVAKLAPDGSSVDVGPSASWIQGNADPADFVAPVKVGDLMYFNSASGTAIQTVTKVEGTTMSFEAGDPFNFNQRGAAAGSITQILTDPLWTVQRVLMFTYYVHEDEPGVPRLMRERNFFPAQALAGVIEDLELSYDLVDGTYNPTAVEDLPYTANSVTYGSSQIRKVNVHIGVRSETISTRTKDYLRNHLSTVVSVRNLAYVDRYK